MAKKQRQCPAARNKEVRRTGAILIPSFQFAQTSQYTAMFTVRLRYRPVAVHHRHERYTAHEERVMTAGIGRRSRRRRRRSNSAAESALQEAA